MARASYAIALILFAFPASAQNDVAGNGYEINCDSAFSSIDDDSTESVCVGVEIMVGELMISAGSATAQRITELIGAWRFSEDVRFVFGTAEVLAGEARFEFVDGELMFAELTGTPVIMSDFIDESQTAVSGRSDSISYDKAGSTFRLTGEATFVRGANRFVGCDWIYNFEDGSFRRGATECGLQITAAAPDDDDDDAAENQIDEP